MKKSLLIALFAIATTTSYATVLTVSNSPYGGAQYSTLQDAYNAASNGDILLVEGTNVQYFTSGYWTKSLIVKGIGFNADKQNLGKTYFSTINLSAGSSGSEFHGIIFNSLVNFFTGSTNMTFVNCVFNSRVDLLDNSTNGITFRNSIFAYGANSFDTGGSTSVVSGVSISNCVFNGYISFRNNVNVSMSIDHCIFLAQPLYQVQNATISNSIFMNTFPSGIAGCNFINNISRVAGTFPPAGSGNTASNNIEATDPLLVNYVSGQYSATHDYNLQAGSAAIAAGSDGTDIGVHGGTNMFFSESGEVLINPIIREVSILTPTVTPNGTLNVKVIATKPKDN